MATKKGTGTVYTRRFLCYSERMPRQSKYTRELLQPIVAGNTTMTDVLKGLGLGLTGGNFRNIKGHIKILGISTEHFKGRAWARGETKRTNPVVAKSAASKRMPDEMVFRENSSYTKLFPRLMNLGWENLCAICSISEWGGKPLRLHVDHMNGEPTDNRLENLRLLCPNCHAQTSTYCRPDLVFREGNRCADCSRPVLRTSTRCKSCAMRARSTKTKIEWPSDEELRHRLSRSNYLQLGRELGVSDNAVRKRLKRPRDPNRQEDAS